jgi:hypothetical protein
MSDTDQAQALLQAHFQAHEAEARAVSEAAWKRPKLGIGEYLKETSDLVDFARSVWNKGPDGAPALKVAEVKLPRASLDRLSDLLDGLQHVSAQEVAVAHPLPDIGPKSDRAQAIIDDISAALSFLLDDDIDEPADADLAALQATTKAADKRSATLGQTLVAWGLLAQAERARLIGLQDFDPALIDEAITLGRALTRAKPTATPAERDALRRLRMGFYTLAYAEVQALRKAASYVYRKHPDIKQRFFSILERKRRTSQRVQKKLNDKLMEAADAADAVDAADTP